MRPKTCVFCSDVSTTIWNKKINNFFFFISKNSITNLYKRLKKTKFVLTEFVYTNLLILIFSVDGIRMPDLLESGFNLIISYGFLTTFLYLEIENQSEIIYKNETIIRLCTMLDIHRKRTS